MGGRPRKPTALLKLTGGFREDRHGDRVDAVASHGSPIKPPSLRGEAGRWWDHLLASAPTGVLTQADTGILKIACEMWADLQFLQRQRLNGTADKNNRRDIRQLRNDYAAICAKFGFTPVDRARLKLIPETEQQPDAKTAFFTGAG